MLRKKFKRHSFCSDQKLASTQTIGSVFPERVRKVQNSKYEHDLLKIIDCFIDGYGFVNSDHISCSIKLFFENPSIFSHMFTKLPKTTKKNSRLSKNLQKIFQTCKKDVSFDFQEVAKNVSIFLTSCKKFSTFLTKCEKCFNFFDKTRKEFHVF